MNIYDGGSSKDSQLSSITGNMTSSEFKFPGSQVFIEFLSNGNGAGKGFSASIKFGKIINQFLQSRICYFDYRITKNVRVEQACW